MASLLWFCCLWAVFWCIAPFCLQHRCWPHPGTLLSWLPPSTQPYYTQPNFSHFFHHLVKVWLITYAISVVAVVPTAPMCNAESTLVGWFGDKPAARRGDAPTDDAFSAEVLRCYLKEVNTGMSSLIPLFLNSNAFNSIFLFIMCNLLERYQQTVVWQSHFPELRK